MWGSRLGANLGFVRPTVFSRQGILGRGCLDTRLMSKAVSEDFAACIRCHTVKMATFYRPDLPVVRTIF
jgi:hypothetical protein